MLGMDMKYQYILDTFVTFKKYGFNENKYNIA
jgi:hypothetical protein